LAAARQRNFQKVIDTCRDWCKARNIDPWQHLYRLVLAVQTESGGLVYSNDGLAFADNAEKVRPGWAEGVPLEQRAKIRAVLRTSLAFGHDAVGNNGGSTGILQQLSQDYVSARFPGKTWGWGTLADTMDISKACAMFLSRLVVTSKRDYLGRDFDPIVADVLRVQQPLISEVDANYGPDEVRAAKHLVDNWSPTYFGSK
jgi:hypothetical protein